MEKTKNRSPNFSSTDLDLLINLVCKYKDIIECKKTDASTWKMKEESWTKITSEFNSLTNGPPRVSKGIKMKYETFKKELRKKISKHKEQLYRTGGGSCESIVLSPNEEKIYTLINLSIEGLPSQFDSDCEYEIIGNFEFYYS